MAARTHPAEAFVKPTEDKCFPARVYPSGAALAEATAVLLDSTPVLLAEPVSWEIEFRCFVLDPRVATFAPYLREGEALVGPDGTWPARVAKSEAAHRYAMAFLADPRAGLGGGGGERGLGVGPVRLRAVACLAGAGPGYSAARRAQPGDAPWARREYVVE